MKCQCGEELPTGQGRGKRKYCVDCQVEMMTTIRNQKAKERYWKKKGEICIN